MLQYGVIIDRAGSGSPAQHKLKLEFKRMLTSRFFKKVVIIRTQCLCQLPRRIGSLKKAFPELGGEKKKNVCCLQIKQSCLSRTSRHRPTAYLTSRSPGPRGHRRLLVSISPPGPAPRPRAPAGIFPSPNLSLLGGIGLHGLGLGSSRIIHYTTQAARKVTLGWSAAGLATRGGAGGAGEAGRGAKRVSAVDLVGHDYCSLGTLLLRAGRPAARRPPPP